MVVLSEEQFGASESKAKGEVFREEGRSQEPAKTVEDKENCKNYGFGVGTRNGGSQLFS
jgi:hypothetical protein